MEEEKPHQRQKLFSKKRSRESSKAGEIFHPLEQKTSFSTAEKAQKIKGKKRIHQHWDSWLHALEQNEQHKKIHI